MADWFADADVEAVAAALIANPAATSIYVADWPEDEQAIFRQHFDVERERNTALRDHRAAKQACAVLAALAPRVAQERAAALREFAAQVEATYPEDVFPEGGTSIDARSAAMARVVAKQARARAADLEREASP